jgi:hypothetical protein
VSRRHIPRGSLALRIAANIAKPPELVAPNLTQAKF